MPLNRTPIAEDVAAHSSLATKLRRALLLRCPRCGSAGVLRHWMKMEERCPTCGLALERGETRDYWLGAYAINFVVAESLTAIIALIVLWRTWPASGPAAWVGTLLAIGMPIVFYPFSRTLWLAFDLTFRPTEVGD